MGSDKLAESFHRAYGLPVVILRPFNTYGPRQSPRAVIPAIIIQALRSRTVRLGALTPRRDLTFVTDTARGFVAAALSAKCVGQTIQLGSGVETSVAELVDLVGGLLNKKVTAISEARRRRPKSSEVDRLLASNRRAADLMGWRPRVPLAKGLEKTIDWFENRSAHYKHDLYHI